MRDLIKGILAVVVAVALIGTYRVWTEQRRNDDCMLSRRCLERVIDNHPESVSPLSDEQAETILEDALAACMKTTNVLRTP